MTRSARAPSSSGLFDTMAPEAFEGTHDLVGLVTVLGFVVSYFSSKLGG